MLLVIHRLVKYFRVGEGRMEAAGGGLCCFGWRTLIAPPPQASLPTFALSSVPRMTDSSGSLFAFSCFYYSSPVGLLGVDQLTK